MFNALKMLGSRLSAFSTSSRLDRDFDREMDAHLALLTEDNIRRGMAPDEARRQAAIRVGNRASLTARHRDVRGLPVLESVLQDLSFACRLIAKNPWFSTAAVVTLALGIGVNAMGFAIVDAAFLRGLPFTDAQQLYMLSWTTKRGLREELSAVELEEWRDQSRSFAGLAAFNPASMSLSDDRGAPEQASGSWMSVNAFSMLGQQPLLGRDFVLEDGRQGAEGVVIIGATIWRNRYGADPNVLGKPIRLNGQPSTIIGVMPDGLKFPEYAEVWAPFVANAAQQARDARLLTVFGRLRSDSSQRAAQTELNGIAQRMLAAYPEPMKDLVGVRVETFQDAFVGGVVRTMFVTMMGAVCFVLLIACANVANLLLSRSVVRAREMAVRVSLGATRSRVVGQLLVESALLSLLGGALGLWLASLGVGVFDSALQSSGRPYWMVFTIDYRIFAYVAAVCVVTAMLFGLAPALHVSKTNNHDVLKDGGRGTVGGLRARRMSTAMVVTELALTFVLLVGAGLMVRSFWNVYRLDVGIRSDHLLAMRIELPEPRYASPAARVRFFDQVETRIAAIAGVDSVAVTTGVPPFDGGERLVEVEGQGNAEAVRRWVSIVTISPKYFDVVEVPILLGRGFQDTDGASGLETVIVNQRRAAEYFRGEDAIGKRLRLNPRGESPGSWLTIVGVSRSIRQGSIQDAEPNPVVYLHATQNPPREASLLVRSELPPGSVMNAVRHEVQQVDQDQPVLSIETMEQMLSQARWPLRTFGGMFALFGVIALILSAVGLYSVMAYAVSQRTQEIGVRMAMGASWQQVSRQVLARGLRHLAIGLAIGAIGALALSRVMLRLLVQIEPADPVTFGAITVLLSLVALLACLLPARRAARVDPVIALRAE